MAVERETILLVEDEPPLRRLIARSLENQGYRLLVASNGREALRLAAECRGAIDLLVTDVVMPRMDGLTLATLLVEQYPETRVLFMTGYADQSVNVREGLEATAQQFLPKPFAQDRLLRAVREQLRT